jgi:DNA-directed RNA polymerase II subunit RPB2
MEPELPVADPEVQEDAPANPFLPFDTLEVPGVGRGRDPRNSLSANPYANDDGTPSKMNQEDSWTVIDSFFQEKGLVFQQLGSFDQFVVFEMQRVIDQQTPIEISPQSQYNPDEQVDMSKVYKWQFGQVTLNKPTVEEKDGSIAQMTPREARLRNLSYVSTCFMNITRKTFQVSEDGTQQQVDETEYKKVEFMKIPIMIRSEYCWLKNADDKQLCEFGECPLDQGGYFVINGSEKVLIALERMANNFVYAFQKMKNSKYRWVCEIRSGLFEGSAGSAGFAVKMMTNMGVRSYCRGQLVCTCPYLRVEVPLIIMFRALGIVADKDILERIVYDFSDIAMLAECRNSIEDAAPINTQEMALDFIAKRGPTMGATRDVRISMPVSCSKRSCCHMWAELLTARTASPTSLGTWQIDCSLVSLDEWLRMIEITSERSEWILQGRLCQHRSPVSGAKPSKI